MFGPCRKLTRVMAITVDRTPFPPSPSSSSSPHHGRDVAIEVTCVETDFVEDDRTGQETGHKVQFPLKRGGTDRRVPPPLTGRRRLSSIDSH
ncbi:hypothetical protein RP20_CCG025970 [Aedes albopictus]|nr:hypothetical protein RP20_CCG025970 [Aedes albopictus]